jgi:amidohydrolase
MKDIMELTNQDIADLVAFRRELHRFPEISNEEEQTARAGGRVPVWHTSERDPHRAWADMAWRRSMTAARPGPTLLFRSELDALPIEELSDAPHRSTVPGKSHMCGHDGHTAILAAMARQLGRKAPARGRVVLMFQPAEETGNGAAGVTADPRYETIRPDFAFSLHNLPGTPLGHVRLKEGVVNCASRGMRIVLSGKTAHSSMPETGTSPMPAVAELMPALAKLGGGRFSHDDFAMVTVTHAEMGEAVFGIAPGRGGLGHLAHAARRAHGRSLRRRRETGAGGRPPVRTRLRHMVDYHEIFVASLNAPEAVAHLRAALDAEGVSHDEEELPMRASEDFGLFGRTRPRRCCSSARARSTRSFTIPTTTFPTI